MLVEFIIFVITALVIYFLYAHKIIHRHFEKHGISYKPGIPVLGNMARSTFQKRHMAQDFAEIYDAFPDDRYVGLLEFTTKAVMLKDPELIKNVTVRDFDHFVDHKEFFPIENEPLFGSSLLMMKGQKWHDMRTTLSPSFTASKIRHIAPFMNEVANNIVQYLRENQIKDIDVDDLVRRYTMDVIASAGFGVQNDSVRDRDNEFYVMAKNMFKLNLKQRLIFMIPALSPSLARILNIQFFPTKTRQFFYDLVSNTIEFRRKNNVERPDMIHLLMESKKEWTLDELTGQVFIFFLAGFDSSASSVIMCIHELAVNTEVQDKLYKEVKEFSEKQQLNYDNINELKYLDCVLNETLRKWPVCFFTDRMCTKTYELPPAKEGGKPYKVSPGDLIYSMVYSIHLDPQYFPDPEKFDPDRFSEENKQNIKPFTFLPFGTGPRACIGTRFALLQLKTLLYNLILNFKIVKCEKTSYPIKLIPSDFNIAAIGGTWVRFEARK